MTQQWPDLFQKRNRRGQTDGLPKQRYLRGAGGARDVVCVAWHVPDVACVSRRA